MSEARQLWRGSAAAGPTLFPDEGFTPTELTLLRGGQAAVIEGILAAAQVDGIAPDDRTDAARTLLLATKLAFEIDDLLGVEHPSLEVMALSAQMIADGTFAREFAAVVAEAQHAAAATAVNGGAAAAAEPFSHGQLIHLPAPRRTREDGDAA